MIENSSQRTEALEPMRIVPAPARAPSLAVRAPAEFRSVWQQGLKWGLLLVLALAPLPLGSARPLAWSMLGVASALLLMTGILAEGNEAAVRSPLPLRAALVLAGLVTLWAVLQSVPIFAPGQRIGLWEAAGTALGERLAPSISLDREESISHLLRLLTYAAIFIVAWRVARRGKNAMVLLQGIAILGTAYSLYGLIVYFSGNHSILWLPKWTYKSDLTSTFVNRNNFATFAGLSLLANLALVGEVLVRSVDARSWRTLAASSIETLFTHAPWRLLALAVNGTAILFTHSRGGAMATLLGVVAFVILTTTAPSLRGAWRMPFISMAVLIVAVVALVSGGGLVERVYDTHVELDARIDVDTEAWSAIADNALFGTGLGTFQFVYPMYQLPSDGLFVDLAHNDYIENILELGIPAAIAFFAIPLLLTLQCVRGVYGRRRDALFPCIGVAAVVLTGCHALVDFSLQIPAVAVTCAALLGIGVAQSVSSAADKPAQLPVLIKRPPPRPAPGTK